MKNNALLTVILIALTYLWLGEKCLAAVQLKTESSQNSFEEISLLSSAQIQTETQPIKLVPVSHGLRKKAVFGLVPVRVYVLEFLAAQPEKLIKTEDGILNSLKSAGPLLLQISFLRDLPGSKISDAFKESLEKNDVNLKAPSKEIEQVLTEVAQVKEFKKNESFSIFFSWKENKASVFLKQGSQDAKEISGDEVFAKQLLSIWFGQSSDSKLHDLKKTLLDIK